MKKKVLIAAYVITAVLLLQFFGTRIVGMLISNGMRSITGFQVSIGSVTMNPFVGVFEVHGIKIFNPPEFSEKLFADIPEIGCDFEWTDFFSKKQIHFKRVSLNLQQLNIIQSLDKDSNLARLQALAPKEKEATRAEKKETAAKKPMGLLIDEFHLTIRHVKYDGFQFRKPVKMELDLNVEKEMFKNITDPNALVRIVTMKVLYGTTFGKLNLGIDTKQVYADLQRQLSKSVDFAKEKLDTALSSETVKEGVAQTKKTLGSLADKMKVVVGEIKK